MVAIKTKPCFSHSAVVFHLIKDQQAAEHIVMIMKNPPNNISRLEMDLENHFPR